MLAKLTKVGWREAAGERVVGPRAEPPARVAVQHRRRGAGSIRNDSFDEERKDKDLLAVEVTAEPRDAISRWCAHRKEQPPVAAQGRGLALDLDYAVLPDPEHPDIRSRL